MTAVAWRTSAGTAARLPVARATNLTRTVQMYAKAGCQLWDWMPTATQISTTMMAPAP